MLDIAVIEDPATAESLLDPVRTRLLEALAEPASATMLASRVGLPRQLVNYHLRTLERHGLVELEAERRKGNVTERIMRASAGSYVISPAALTGLQPDPARSPDQRSAVWLLALGARLVRDVGALLAGATRERRPLSTFALDAEVRFASAADRAAFADELARRGDLAHRPVPRRRGAPRPDASGPRGHPPQHADQRPVTCPEGGLT